MIIQILVDNPTSWIVPYAKNLSQKVLERGHECHFITRHEDVMEGDILCLLSCEQIFHSLELNKHNLVVHESALPHGKGWSPLTWQILEGKNSIPITLFEAAKNVDSGVIYLQDQIVLEGHELIGEIKDKQGNATIKLILDFLDKYPNISGRKQVGTSTYYPRRKAADSKLDLDKSLRSQFDLLRVCDNERYPAYFEIHGRKYTLKTYTEPKQS
jgi:methionyl-tRNA formyltransferase